jgi:hypothetical protein
LSISLFPFCPLLFNEEFNSLKVIIAFVIALPMAYLFSVKTENKNNKWIYPTMVLVGFGVIDILFKFVH